MPVEGIRQVEPAEGIGLQGLGAGEQFGDAAGQSFFLFWFCAWP